jgi:hypothetical protein
LKEISLPLSFKAAIAVAAPVTYADAKIVRKKEARSP